MFVISTFVSFEIVYIYIDTFEGNENTLISDNKVLLEWQKNIIVKRYKDMMYLYNFKTNKII